MRRGNPKVSERAPSKTNAHQGGRPVQAIHTTAKHLRPLSQEAREASHDGFDRGRREGCRDAGLSGVMTCVLGHIAATVLLGQAMADIAVALRTRA
jgi:hypothetical protein